MILTFDNLLSDRVNFFVATAKKIICSPERNGQALSSLVLTKLLDKAYSENLRNQDFLFSNLLHSK